MSHCQELNSHSVTLYVQVCHVKKRKRERGSAKVDLFRNLTYYVHVDSTMAPRRKAFSWRCRVLSAESGMRLCRGTTSSRRCTVQSQLPPTSCMSCVAPAPRATSRPSCTRYAPRSCSKQTLPMYNYHCSCQLAHASCFFPRHVDKHGDANACRIILRRLDVNTLP